MPLLLNTSTDWQSKARETRAAADQTTDPATKAWLLQLVGEYERLARLVAERATSLK
jgi:hypothetical protein